MSLVIHYDRGYPNLFGESVDMGSPGPQVHACHLDLTSPGDTRPTAVRYEWTCDECGCKEIITHPGNARLLYTTAALRVCQKPLHHYRCFPSAAWRVMPGSTLCGECVALSQKGEVV